MKRHMYSDEMFARSLFDEYVRGTHLLICSTTSVHLISQSLVITLSQATNWLEKVKGLELDGDRSINCGSYEYLYIIE